MWRQLLVWLWLTESQQREVRLSVLRSWAGEDAPLSSDNEPGWLPLFSALLRAEFPWAPATTPWWGAWSKQGCFAVVVKPQQDGAVNMDSGDVDEGISMASSGHCGSRSCQLLPSSAWKLHFQSKFKLSQSNEYFPLLLSLANYENVGLLPSWTFPGVPHYWVAQLILHWKCWPQLQPRRQSADSRSSFSLGYETVWKMPAFYFQIHSAQFDEHSQRVKS